MSYISAMLSEDRKNVVVWERTEDNRRVKRIYDAPYYFYSPDPDGDYSDIYGRKLSKLEFNNSKVMWDAKQEFHGQGIKLYESDISPVYKVLSQHYYNKPIHKLNVTFLDIEADYSREVGFPSVENPYAAISSLAMYHQHTDRMVVYCVPSSTTDPAGYRISEETKKLAEVVVCQSESELLKHFLDEIEDSDILSGWNSDYFDIPYIYLRLKANFGEATANRMSFPSALAPKFREVERKFGGVAQTLDLFGRVSLDSLEVFKKFEQSMYPSYALESIAETLFPYMPKLEFEGSLYTLYRNDFDKFVQYNIRDVEILREIERTRKYIKLAIDMSHLSTGLIPNVTGTIKLAELAIINFCHYQMNTIVPDSNVDESTEGGKFAGALVLQPQTGMHEWLSAIDVSSLYPSAIRALNMSPETVIGQFNAYHAAYAVFNGDGNEELTLVFDNNKEYDLNKTLKSETRPVSEWKQIFIDNQWAISGYGTVFSLKKQGFIPAILESWYMDRKAFQKRLAELEAKKAQIKAKGTLTEEDEKQLKEITEEAGYCDRIQYIKKIQLNSMYGALGNRFFKFFDVRLAESTTRTGREVLLHMCKKTAELLDGEYTLPSESVIYGDTDSCYFKTHAPDRETAQKITKIVEKKVNESFPQFLRENFLTIKGYDHLVECGYEFISDRGIFVKPKHYILHLVEKKNREADDMKVMGVQLKKTTIPKPISKQLTKYIESLLKGKPWKEIGKDLVDYKDVLLKTENIMNIGLPKGVNNMEDYVAKYEANEPDLKIPGHVSAAIFWNSCLDDFKDKESIKITSGTKIKVFYLKTKYGRFKSIAVPTDTRELPGWFKKHFEKDIDREAQVKRLIDQTLKNIVGAIGETIPTKKSLLVDELFEY